MKIFAWTCDDDDNASPSIFQLPNYRFSSSMSAVYKGRMDRFAGKVGDEILAKKTYMNILHSNKSKIFCDFLIRFILII